MSMDTKAMRYAPSPRFLTRHNVGQIGFPALTITPEEMSEIEAGVSMELFKDKQADQLEALRAELSQLQTLAFSSPIEAVQILTAERRRANLN